MVRRRPRPPVLTHRAPAVLLGAILAVIVAAPPAVGHNEWNGGYRKFPWKASRDRTLSTLPGQCPHCPGVQSSSAWKAIDVADMDYETVYSIAPGTVDVYDATGGGAGQYLRILDKDGSYVVYEHLSKPLVTSGSVVAGEPIAVSGCSGNCNGAHLHFQRQSGPSFSSTALDLVPISGHGFSDDPLARAEYTGDNAGIGISSGGGVSETMQAAYRGGGGYRGIGVTADIGLGWTPCRSERTSGTWWRYGCAPRSGIAGSVQTYFADDGERRAIMHPSGEPASYVLHPGILGAYTEIYAGEDWVYWLGYPVGNRYPIYSGAAYRQNFERGHIVYWPSSCKSAIYVDGDLKSEEYFCD